MRRRLAGGLFALLALALALPTASSAQEAPQSVVRGTITVDGHPPRNLETVITVTSDGIECGNALPLNGFYGILVTCPAGPAFVNVNGVAAAQFTLVPGTTHVVDIVLPLATPIAGAGTPRPAGTVPAGGTPRPPATGERGEFAGEGPWLAAMTLLGVLGLLAGGAVAVRSTRW
jgi:hypothetical protein